MPSEPSPAPLQNGLRLLDGLSFAALRTLFTKGPGAARKVVGATLGAVQPKRNPWTVSPWDIARAFATPESVAIHGGDWTDGTTAPLERFIIALLLRSFAPRQIVEVGTYRGVTTRLLLDNLPSGAHLHTIDLPPAVDPQSLTAATDARLIITREVGIQYHSHPLADRVTQILGNTFEPATWSQVPEGVEFAFIDASHSYEAARNDTERLWPKLMPGAVVIWHDYTETVSAERGVGKYIRERLPSDAGIFLCEGTDLALRLPVEALRAGEARVAAAYPPGHAPVRKGPLVPAWHR